MKKLVVLAALGLMNTVTAFAQYDMDVYESDRRYCASGRSGLDFSSCMRRLQYDRDRYHGNQGRRDDWDGRQPQWQPSPPPPPVWANPPPRQWQQERPRLSDMQQRALDNCVLLAPREQPKCRATVMSTVR